jgi:hypothetical protein
MPMGDGSITVRPPCVTVNESAPPASMRTVAAGPPGAPTVQVLSARAGDARTLAANSAAVQRTRARLVTIIEASEAERSDLYSGRCGEFAQACALGDL